MTTRRGTTSRAHARLNSTSNTGFDEAGTAVRGESFDVETLKRDFDASERENNRVCYDLAASAL